jgi:hypothetical protein
VNYPGVYVWAATSKGYDPILASDICSAMPLNKESSTSAAEAFGFKGFPDAWSWSNVDARAALILHRLAIEACLRIGADPSRPRWRLGRE